MIGLRLSHIFCLQAERRVGAMSDCDVAVLIDPNIDATASRQT